MQICADYAINFLQADHAVRINTYSYLSKYAGLRRRQPREAFLITYICIVYRSIPIDRYLVNCSKKKDEKKRNC